MSSEEKILEETSEAETKEPVWTRFLFENKLLVLFLLVGLSLTGVGVFLYKDGQFGNETTVEVLNDTTGFQEGINNLVVEVAGAVQKPGVYELPFGSRVNDVLVIAGGLSGEADREWMAKMVNLAAKLSDGQKIYIPFTDEQTVVLSAKEEGGGTASAGDTPEGAGQPININTASQDLLDTLPGIGPVYAQKIVEYRPYSNTEELVNKEVMSRNLFEKIKDRITVY